MPNASKELSVAVLERLLTKRRSLLDTLTRRRDQLRKNLEKIEHRIASLAGRNGGGPGKVTRRRKRPKNAKPLHQVVTEILSKSKTGFPLAKLAQKVLASGYKSNSSNFTNVLYQCLYNDSKIVHDGKTGNYRLKGATG